MPRGYRIITIMQQSVNYSQIYVLFVLLPDYYYYICNRYFYNTHLFDAYSNMKFSNRDKKQDILHINWKQTTGQDKLTVHIVLWSEGTEPIMSKFGKDNTNYLCLLQLVATGLTTQSEIDGDIGKNTRAYLDNSEES